MAGANNKALKKAGMTAREVETFRATGGKSLRATVTAAKHSPTVQGANADFRAKAAAGLKNVAERKAALQAARQQRVGKSLGAAMQVARGMRQKQAADAAQKAAAAGSAAKANPKTVRAAGDAARMMRERAKTGMFPASRAAIEAAAHRRAAELADAALTNLAAGRRVFVKGKPTIVPFSDENRAERKRLQLSAFEDGYASRDKLMKVIAPLYKREGIRDAKAEERFIARAHAVYEAAGRAEIHRRFR